MGFFIRPFTLCSPHTVRSQHSRCHAIALSGLTEWQVKSLLKYRAKGGVFRQPADFARLYGLTQRQFKQLQPYIRISDDYRPAAELFAHQEKTTAYQRDTVKFPIKLKEGAHVLLNTADTSVLKKIPGIGSYFARQIVAYRNRLGGYSSVSQLAEIDDFPSETLSFFQLSADDASRIRKLNLNKLTLNELKRHPYISFYQARAIVDYRRLHGALRSLDDLKLLNDFSEDKIRQLQPYVEF
nr:helix-hairpin-helix domain-containing protein [Hoylesella saccharolytica]